MNKFSNNNNKYPLEERTAVFAENTIDFLRTIKQDNISSPIINQLIRSSTSIGANYCEANGASSKKDFQNKIFICKKECHETKYWLRLLARSNNELNDKCQVLWKEAQELTMIFTKILSSLKNN